MKSSPVKFVFGFLCLFALYHAAEYMIVFKKNPGGFLAFQGVFFVAAWIIAQWQFKENLAAWGLSLKKHFIQHLLLGMMMGIILYGVTYIINLVSGAEVKVAIPQLPYIISPLLLFVFGNFFSSFSEDILTRGYLYRHVHGKVSVPVFIFITATVYLFNHIYRLNDGWATWSYLFALGVLFAIPLVLTKRLWFTSGMHWAGNIFFYFTHNLIQTIPGKTAFDANYTFIICIVLMIPVNYYFLKSNNMIEKEVSKPEKLPVA